MEFANSKLIDGFLKKTKYRFIVAAPDSKKSYQKWVNQAYYSQKDEIKPPGTNKPKQADAKQKVSAFYLDMNEDSNNYGNGCLVSYDYDYIHME